jgi:putative transposase
MKTMELNGVIRGKPVKTTIQDKRKRCPFDKVNRAIAADRPNKL